MSIFVKKDKNQIFGKPLPNDPKNLPEFILEGLIYLEKKGLKSEGIFRLSGDNNIMQEFKKKIDSGKKIDFSSLDDINCVSGLIKLYFRELPEPLCTYDHYEMFMAATGIPDKKQRLVMIKKVIKFLPLSNLKLMKILCRFLSKVIKNEEYNKMSAANLAICFAPNLLKRRPDEKLDTLEQFQEMMQDTPHANGLMTTLIEECDYMFPIEEDEKEEYIEEMVEEKEEDKKTKKEYRKATLKMEKETIFKEIEDFE
jgi:hypothetical protein